MNRLIMTVGLPRSGKTTWARSTGLPIVDIDAIWVALGNRGTPVSCPKQIKIVSGLTRTIITSLFLSGNREIVLCGLFLTKAQREFWVDPMWGRIFKLFDTPYEVCKERSPGGEWLEHLEQKYKSFQPITPEELREGEKVIQ